MAVPAQGDVVDSETGYPGKAAVGRQTSALYVFPRDLVLLGLLPLAPAYHPHGEEAAAAEDDERHYAHNDGANGGPVVLQLFQHRHHPDRGAPHHVGRHAEPVLELIVGRIEPLQEGFLVVVDVRLDHVG